MPTYHFRLFDRLGRLAVGHFIDLDSDDQAREHASKFLAVEELGSVEVWDNNRSVYREAKSRSPRPR